MLWVVLCAWAGLFLPGTHAVGTYSVVAPKIFRPNRDYTVVVSIHGTDGIVRATAEIGGRQDSGGAVLNRQVVELQPDSSQTIKFEVGELGPGVYNLTVAGFGSLTFVNSTALQYESKSYSVFIQTDRAVYNQGDSIRFRAIVVNPFLKPSVTGAINVYVTDGAGNMVKQWLRVFTNRGVFSAEIPLADQPVLGIWNITVEVLGQLTTTSVLVAQYILPKFDVELELPKYATFQDREIVATIKSQYTYGRPVKGEVTLQVVPTYKFGYLQPAYDNPYSVVRPLKGKTDITVNLFRDLQLREDYVRELQFTAYVKEDLTQRVQNASSKLIIYRFPYRMEFIRTSDSFKPGLKYTGFLKMAFHDETPIRSGQVIVRHAFSRDQKDFVESRYPIPPNGIIPLEFYPPWDDQVLNLALEAQYEGLTQWLADLTRAQSPSNAFIQATLLTQTPKVGGEVLVQLNATEPLLYFVYEILGRGNIIYAQTLQAHEGTSDTFRFVSTSAMAPRARLIVYYVRHDGEVVADSLHFSVDGALQNEVSVSINPRTVDAGMDVSFTVTTKPNAYVGISAIDQSSLLLSREHELSRNELTEDAVLEELESYDPGLIDSRSPWHILDGKIKGSRTKRSLFSWHGTTTASDVFKNAGMVILTNGLVYDYNPYVAGLIPSGFGPVDGSSLDRGTRRSPAVDGPFGRPFVPLDSSTLRPDLFGPGVEYYSPERPPLAGPYAFSFLPSPHDDKPRIFLNKALPRSWIFRDLDTRLNGVVTLREKAPDSITSYVISAFSIDDFYGLGVVKNPAMLTVFRPFFLSLNLPPSVKRGEAVAVEVVVFNYGRSPVFANVTLFNPGPGEFLFPDFNNEIEEGSPDRSRSRLVEVPAEDGVAVSFMIVPQLLGSIEIKVLATSSNAVDVVTKRLIVKPEGTPLMVNRALLVDLRSDSSFSELVKIEKPFNIVRDSLQISVSVIGDVIGPVMGDLNSLLEIPSGCGEQNMAKMVPNIVMLDYLKSKNLLTENYLTKAQRNMEVGYQRQLTYRHTDGSFSAFGNDDNNGSVWLTAFVVKSLGRAKENIHVDDNVIIDAADWLMERQELDGSFRENGSISNAAIQGEAFGRTPLTAYVAIALLQLEVLGVEGIRNSINRALEYLVSQLEVEDYSYPLSISSYALHLANHPLRDSAFYQLESKAKVEGERKWWEDKPVRRTLETTVESRPLDIEMTSYALLVYGLRGLVRDSLPVIKWLLAQRNTNGGFQSSQDTAIGMQALASLASQMTNPNPRLEVQAIAGTRGETFLVNDNNVMTLQRKEIANSSDAVMIKARGSGFAVVQVSYTYNVDVTGPSPSFSLDPQVEINTDSSRLQLTACTGFTSPNASNMAIMDVGLPSGYVVDDDLIFSLYKYERVKRVEKKEDSAGVLIYFNNLTNVEVCPTISAYRVNKVAFQRKAPVKIYDYYDLSRQARQFYSPLPATLCDICDLDECDEFRCERQIVELNRQRSPVEYSYFSGGVQLMSSLAVTIASAIFLLRYC